MNRVNLSNMIQKGLDISVAGVTKDAEGSLMASTERWQLAMQYAILKELKDMNGNVRVLAMKYDRMHKDLQRIDRRLAMQIKLPKGRTKQ